MNLRDLAVRDIARITTNIDSGFAAQLFITAPTSDTFTINGLQSNHRITVDGEGKQDNAKNVHCSFSESEVVALGISIRNSRNEVHLKDYTVRIDLNVAGVPSPGITYRIREWWPSETTGLIVCLLGDIES